MVTTNSRDLWSRMWSYKDHGKSWEAVYEQSHPPGFRWLHESIGTNWRMTEMQAAIGRIQLKRMPSWSRARRANCERIWSTSQQCNGLRVPKIPGDIEHAGYKCYVFVEPNDLNDAWSRDKIINEIVANGVPCFSGSCSEVYLEKAFVNFGYAPHKRHRNTQALGETSLMFLVHPTLSKDELDKTCEVIRSVMAEAVA